jgi:hypothetical protein
MITDLPPSYTPPYLRHRPCLSHLPYIIAR